VDVSKALLEMYSRLKKFKIGKVRIRVALVSPFRTVIGIDSLFNNILPDIFA
jgi:hypothetical protein